MTVKITGTLPQGDANGLEAIVSSLINEPERQHVVIAVLDCRKVVTDHVNGDVIPQARVLRIEVVDDVEDGPRLLRLMERGYERRTGREMVPLEIEEQFPVEEPGEPE